MKNTKIIFRGIDRRSFGNAVEQGRCEELINVRPENGQMRLVSPKTTYCAAQGGCLELIEQVTGNSVNLIVHSHTTIHLFYWVRPSESAVLINTDTNIPISDDVYFSCLGDFLVISDRTEVRNWVYRFNGTSYELHYDDSQLNLSVSYSVSRICSPTASGYEITQALTESDIFINDDSSVALSESNVNKDKVSETMLSFRNKCIEQYSGRYAEGYVVTMITLSLMDGSEIPYGTFKAHKLSRYDSSHIGESSDECSSIVRISRYEAYYLVSQLYSYGGIDVTISSDNYESFKNKIKYVNIYSTAPYSVLDSEKGVSVDIDSAVSSQHNFLKFDAANPKEGTMDKQLLYLQHRIYIDKLTSLGNTYKLYFGKDLTTNETMPVLESVQRAGKSISYNRRLHFFDSSAKFKSYSSYITSCLKTGIGTLTADAYVFLLINNTTKVVRHAGLTINYAVLTQQNYVSMETMMIYPDSRVYRIVLKNTSDNTICDIPLYSSSAYNYSFAYDNKYEFWANQSVLTELAQYESSGDTIIYDELTAINVSNQDTPITFNVSNSYKVDSPITGLAVANDEVSQIQTGQYPVYVFTKRGIYALQQGSGEVLYSSLIPINSDNVDGDVKNTRSGIAYISEGRVMLINGRKSVCLSELLDDEPDLSIRGVSGSSFNLCCCNDSLYNISSLLSNYPSGVTDRYFRNYISGANINYSSYDDELIVSNVARSYSYIFSFKYNFWYKTSELYYPSLSQKYILRSISTGADIADYASRDKADTVFHIQTRPIELTNDAYTLIERTILNASAVIDNNGELLSFYIFASDNMKDWVCVAGAQKQNCTLRGVRPNRVNKSYRYYVFIAGGKLMSDSEITFADLSFTEVMDRKKR